MVYKYYCPECGYENNSRRYFQMRNNSDGHECYAEDNPDYNEKYSPDYDDDN